MTHAPVVSPLRYYIAIRVPQELSALLGPYTFRDAIKQWEEWETTSAPSVQVSEVFQANTREEAAKVSHFYLPLGEF